uniref:Uncharacterized protein n=1 Tax=Arundo donax TaxID=35708 RepID=A0A0A8YPX2_ARUDO
MHSPGHDSASLGDPSERMNGGAMDRAKTRVARGAVEGGSRRWGASREWRLPEEWGGGRQLLPKDP